MVRTLDQEALNRVTHRSPCLRTVGVRVATRSKFSHCSNGIREPAPARHRNGTDLAGRVWSLDGRIHEQFLAREIQIGPPQRRKLRARRSPVTKRPVAG
jgi:hypothetical protein